MAFEVEKPDVPEPVLPEIPDIEGLEILDCRYCPWLKQSPEYQPNHIKKLIRLQNWFKSYLMSKKLTLLLKELLPLYYHPDAKGGWLHKRDMMQFFDNQVC